MTDLAIDPTQLQEGMEVLSTDGELIGHVQNVGADALQVARIGRPSMSVPFAFIRYTSGSRVVLTIPAYKADEMHWSNAS